jgi:hypothetical protein
MIDDGGDENAGDDRERLSKPRGEDKRQQLSLVADLGNGDRRHGDEEGFHMNSSGPGAL